MYSDVGLLCLLSRNVQMVRTMSLLKQAIILKNKDILGNKVV